MNILLCGALGHMGLAVAEQSAAKGLTIACGVDPRDGTAAFPLYTSIEDVPAGSADVIIDFSNPAGLTALLAYAKAHHLPAVLCTTGYSESQLKEIDEAAKEIAVFRSANMSVGIALLRALSRKAAAVLGDSFDAEITETHHNRKLDAPSGTAKMLVKAVQEGFETPHEPVYGRSGNSCKRQHEEIGVHALRGGTVTGEHSVFFFGPYERITLSHSAESRSVFASGALQAASFLLGRDPGMYDMDDIVGSI